MPLPAMIAARMPVWTPLRPPVEYGYQNEFTSFQLSERIVNASPAIDAATLVPLQVPSGGALKSPCMYTGFSDAIAIPQATVPHEVPKLSDWPSTIFSARRK